MRGRAGGAIVTLLLLSTPRPAKADAASDAKDLFDRGRELRAAGDCAGALPLFHKAYEIFPQALGPLRNAAECEESTGRWASARRTWLDLERAVMLSSDPKYAGWNRDADEAAARLAPRVAHLTVDVSTGGHHNDWLEVTINGEPLPLTLVGTTLERDPGKYDIKARLGSGEPAEQIVDLVTGEARTVHLAVTMPSQRLLPQPRDASSSAWTPMGWITLSVGLAALAGMFIAVGVRQEALTTLTTQCPSLSNCDPSLEPARDRGIAASTATSVLAVAGGITTAAGILMLVVGAVQKPHERFGFYVSPFGAGVHGSFQ